MAQKMNNQTSIPTGFPAFDKITSGLSPGDLVIIAGRRGMGKSTFALSMARNIAVDSGYGVAYFSLELPLQKLYWKMSVVDMKADNCKDTSSDKRVALGAPFYVDDTPALSVAHFRENCLQIMKNNDVRVAVIDYLQLMKKKDDGRHQENILAALKEIANELNITIVALSEHNPPYENQADLRLNLSDMTDKKIVEYADIVAFIYSLRYDSTDDSTEESDFFEIKIVQNPNDNLGYIRLFSNPYYSSDEHLNEIMTQIIDEKSDDVHHYLNMDVENLSAEQLENLIMRLYYRHEKTEAVKDKLDEALSERKYKKNQTFEWTPENKVKLLRLNQQLIDCWEKLDVEAKQTFKTLKSRLTDSDEFLHDFNIEAVVMSLIHIPDENGDYDDAQNCIEEVLIDSLDENYCVNRHDYYSLDSDDPSNDLPLYLNRKQNWSDDPIFKGKFDGHFISQAVHDLYDHSCLSMSDILKINRLRSELRIINKRIVEV